MIEKKYNVGIITLLCIAFIIIYMYSHTFKHRMGLSIHILTKDKYRFLPYNQKILDTNDIYGLLHLQHPLPTLQCYDVIPKRLFQIYMFYKAPIPQYIFDAVHQHAPDYKHIVLDELDAITFLQTFFHPMVLQRFYDMTTGAHKADLLRYCLLYVYGGVYLDIKTILVKPLHQIFTRNDCLYSSISVFKHTIHNGIIASKPRNQFFLHLIWYIVHGPIEIINNKLYYLTFCRDFYTTIQKDISRSTSTVQNIHAGFHQGKTQNYYLFEERCPLLSNRECNNSNFQKVCCAIYDKKDKVFITRDANFPWT